MLHEYAGIGLLIAVAFVFPFIPMVVSAWLQRKKPTTEKLVTYECGVDTIGRNWEHKDHF